MSTPVTDKESEDGENELFKYGVCAMQGWRTEMVRASAWKASRPVADGACPGSDHIIS